MLQSIVSAVLLYHLIKALARGIRKRKKPVNSPPPISAAINAPPQERALPPEAAIWRNLIEALGNKPWMESLLSRAQTVMGLRSLVLGASFALVACFLIGMSLVMVSETSTPAEDDLWAMLIIGAIGLGTGWMALHFWRDGLRLIKAESSAMPVTGMSVYAAAKPQPATNSQKKREKQFQQL